MRKIKTGQDCASGTLSSEHENNLTEACTITPAPPHLTLQRETSLSPSQALTEATSQHKTVKDRRSYPNEASEHPEMTKKDLCH